jgi:hypothetical protein
MRSWYTQAAAVAAGQPNGRLVGWVLLECCHQQQVLLLLRQQWWTTVSAAFPGSAVHAHMLMQCCCTVQLRVLQAGIAQPQA